MSITYQKNMTNLLRYTSFGPSLNLVSGGELQNETPITFTRNTKRHYWDQSGLVQTAAVDTLPTSFDPADNSKYGWPIMGQWTNEILDPRDMTTGNWSADDNLPTVTRDQVGIDGATNTACLIEDNDINDDNGIRQDVVIPNNSNSHTVSVFVKKDNNTTRFVGIEATMFGGSVLSNILHLNTSDGSIAFAVNSNSPTAETHDKGDFWKVDLTVTNDSTGNTTLSYALYPAHNDVLGGGGTEGDGSVTGSAVFDCAQLFLNRSSAPPTPVYGETAGQSYTQDPDIATVTDLDSIGFNPDEGTIIAGSIKQEAPTDTGTTIVSINDGSDNNEIYFGYRDPNGAITAAIRVNDGTFEFGHNGGIPTFGDINKVALSYKKDDSAIALDGSILSTDDTVNMPSVSQLNIGYGFTESYLNGFLISLKYYPRRLSDAQLQQLTS